MRLSLRLHSSCNALIGLNASPRGSNTWIPYTMLTIAGLSIAVHIVCTYRLFLTLFLRPKITRVPSKKCYLPTDLGTYMAISKFTRDAYTILLLGSPL